MFITGLGAVSSIGMSVEETHFSIWNLRPGIGPITILETRHADSIPVAEIHLSNDDLCDAAGVSHGRGVTRTTLLGMFAARNAVRDAGWDDCASPRTGCISATSVGGMDRTERSYTGLLRGDGDMHAAVTHDCGDSTERIAQFLGITGFRTTISTACSGSANAIMLGAKLIHNGVLDRVVVGGTDALTTFTLNGFSSLMILSKTGCRPFDEHRDGLTLGEGAAYLTLESEGALQARGGETVCELRGYGNACDAYHQTATSPEGDGPTLAMQAALECSGLTADRIDYINAHGTGTVNNDLSEGKAIMRVFGEHVPPMSSTKAFTGHCLGAAGAIEAVLSCLAIRHDTLLPNFGFNEQMKELRFPPVVQLMPEAGIRNVLSNSFGFGGNSTSLVFSRC